MKVLVLIGSNDRELGKKMGYGTAPTFTYSAMSIAERLMKWVPTWQYW